MSETLIVAIISFLGTVVGTVGGIVLGNKLTAYRVEQLEKKIDEYKSLVDRIYTLEAHDQVFQARIDALESLINTKFDTIKEKQDQLISELQSAMVGT